MRALRHPHSTRIGLSAAATLDALDIRFHAGADSERIADDGVISSRANSPLPLARTAFIDRCRAVVQVESATSMLRVDLSCPTLEQPHRCCWLALVVGGHGRPNIV